MSHTCPWGRLQGVSSHHLPGKAAGARARCQPLPSCQVRITRLPDKWWDCLNTETLSPFPEGFMDAGLSRSPKQGAGRPPGNSPARHFCHLHGWNFPSSQQPQPSWRSTLSFQIRGKRENVSICPNARFLLALLRTVLTLLALQWKEMSRWAAACHLDPRL